MLEKKELEAVINDNIYQVIKELLENNNQISNDDIQDIEDYFSVLDTNPEVKDKIIKERDALDIMLQNLDENQDINVEHDKRCKVKKKKFLDLVLYLLDVRDKMLNSDISNPDVIYGSILSEYIKVITDVNSKIKTPGMAVGLKDKQGAEIYFYTGRRCNVTNYNGDKFKVDRNTQFDVASITKTFTTLQALKKHEDNILDINENVSNYEILSTKDKRYNNLDIPVIEMAKFGHKIITDGRIDDDISKRDLENRLYGCNVMKNCYIYSDIPYVVLGDLIYDQDYFTECFQREMKMINTGYGRSFYHNQGFNGNNLTGSKFSRKGLPSDPKARSLMSYGMPSGHAGLFTTSEDLTKLLSGINEGFLREESIQNLITPLFSKPIKYNDSGIPHIINGKYVNKNKAMGVYIPHPYGINHTEVVDVLSSDSFSAVGSTGCYTTYDLKGGMTSNILANPFEIYKTKPDGYNHTLNELKEQQIYTMIALRVAKKSLEEVAVKTASSKLYYKTRKVFTKRIILKT